MMRRNRKRIPYVGLSKKIGLPDYGSLGSSCNVSFEAEHGLLDRDLEGFHQRVKNAFVACRQVVYAELAREREARTKAAAVRAMFFGNSRRDAVLRSPSFISWLWIEWKRK